MTASTGLLSREDHIWQQLTIIEAGDVASSKADDGSPAFSGGPALAFSRLHTAVSCACCGTLFLLRRHLPRRALYAVLLSPEVAHTAKAPMFLALLFKVGRRPLINTNPVRANSSGFQSPSACLHLVPGASLNMLKCAAGGSCGREQPARRGLCEAADAGRPHGAR